MRPYYFQIGAGILTSGKTLLGQGLPMSLYPPCAPTTVARLTLWLRSAWNAEPHGMRCLVQCASCLLPRLSLAPDRLLVPGSVHFAWPSFLGSTAPDDTPNAALREGVAHCTLGSAVVRQSLVTSARALRFTATLEARPRASAASLES